MKLNLSMTIREGYYGQIVGRSGLANMYSIIAYDGTIDSDYRVVVCVVLFNLSDEEYMVETGNLTAQLIIQRCFTSKFVKFSKFMYDNTEEDEKGFGSSGI